MEFNPQDLDLTGHNLGKETHSPDGDDDYLPSSDGSQRSVKNPRIRKVENVETVTNLNDTTYSFAKWVRLQSNYSDAYLELCNKVWSDGEHDDTLPLLSASTIGAVHWNSDEKDRLFNAIGKFGQRDLHRLSGAVGSKSIIEILSYLDAVQNAQVDRQLFTGNTKNVSIVDISAAVEISPECEDALNKAADALSAYQEQYDVAYGQRVGGPFWLIDRTVAARLDIESDEAETNPNIVVKSGRRTVTSEEPAAGSEPDECHRMFHLQEMLDLSEQYFMNQPSGSVYPHWQDISEPRQRPEITHDTVQTLYGLVVERLQNIIRVATQIAHSRISSMIATGYNPSQKLSGLDVAAALDVLDMPHNSWDFWAMLARKNGLKVVTGSHSKGETRHQVISYKDAEAVLAERKGRDGRRRSMSIGSRVSQTESDDIETEYLSSASEGSSIDAAESSDARDEIVNDTEGDLHDDLDVTAHPEFVNSSDSEVLDEPSSRFNRNDESAYCELDELEEYVERIDQAAKVAEERKLLQVLGKRPHADIKEEDNARRFGPRPKTVRKSEEEVNGWSCTYMAEWELFGHMLDADVAPVVSVEEMAEGSLSEANQQAE